MDKNKKTNKKRKPLRKPVKWPFWLFLMTIFQLVCMLQIYINGTQASNVTLFTVYGVYIAAEWVYFIVFGLILRRKSFEVELIAFFLTGIGLTLTTSVYPDKAFTQLAAVLMGIIVFIAIFGF